MREKFGGFFGVEEKKKKVEEKVEEKRARVDKLKETDNHYEDSIYDLAKTEDEFRKYLADEGIAGKALTKVVDKLTDKFSDETLGKIEANKERWMDVLTGLRNKNAYKEEVPQLLSMEKRKDNSNCSFLMIDFDHFKKVNDSFGHLVGDMALKKMAEIIKNQVRSSDIVYRFGGEEFIVFLPSTNSSQAQAVAEKIRSTVENSSLEIDDEKEGKIILNKTVSIGVVGTDQMKSWKDCCEDNVMEFLEEVIKVADDAVFVSKAGGRNKVTVYEENLEK